MLMDMLILQIGLQIRGLNCIPIRQGEQGNLLYFE